MHLTLHRELPVPENEPGATAREMQSGMKVSQLPEDRRLTFGMGKESLTRRWI